MELKDLCLKCFNQLEKCECHDSPFTDFNYENPNYALKPGTVLGEHFLIGPQLARGGFGIIYLGLQTNLHRKVAVKEYFPKKFAIRDENFNVKPIPSEEDGFNKYLNEFFMEGPVLGRINHRNVVNIYEFLKEKNTGYLVMEYLDGYTLDVLQQKEKISILSLLGISISIIKGLRAIHNSGFLYLDLKPQNICVTHKGEIKILDLGNTRSILQDTTKFTAKTPGFASPEQEKNNVDLMDIRTDIYSLGATMASLWTGETPPNPEKRFKYLQKQIDDIVILSVLGSHDEVSFSVEQIIRKCLSLNIRDRYQNLDAIEEDIVLQINKLKKLNRNVSKSQTGILSINEIDNNILLAGAKHNLPKKSFNSFILKYIFPPLISIFILFLFFYEIDFSYRLYIGIPFILCLIGLILLIRKPIWQLNFINGQYRDLSLDITKTIYIGRDKSKCNIVYNSDSVSRVHALILKKRNALFIKDLDSRSGIFLNRKRIPPKKLVPLNQNDVIKIGNEMLIIKKMR